MHRFIDYAKVESLISNLAVQVIPCTKPAGCMNTHDFGLDTHIQMIEQEGKNPEQLRRTGGNPPKIFEKARKTVYKRFFQASYDADDVAFRRSLFLEHEQSPELQELLKRIAEKFNYVHQLGLFETKDSSYSSSWKHEDGIEALEHMREVMENFYKTTKRLPAWKTTGTHFHDLYERTCILLEEYKAPQSIAVDIELNHGYSTSMCENYLTKFIDNTGLVKEHFVRMTEDRFEAVVYDKDKNPLVKCVPFNWDTLNRGYADEIHELSHSISLSHLNNRMSMLFAQVKDSLPASIRLTPNWKNSHMHIHFEYREDKEPSGYITFFDKTRRAIGAGIAKIIDPTSRFSLTDKVSVDIPSEAINVLLGLEKGKGSLSYMIAKFLENGLYTRNKDHIPHFMKNIRVNRFKNRIQNLCQEWAANYAVFTGLAEFVSRESRLNCDPERQTAYAVPVDSHEDLCFTNLCHPNLSMNGIKPVGNDFICEPGKNIHPISGPNTHGKTTFINAIALNAWRHQCGLKIFAEEAHLPYFDNILVMSPQSHEEGTSAHEKQCEQFAEYLKKVTGSSLTSIDDFFTATDPYEGMEILKEIILGLGENCGLVFASTHYHNIITELAKQRFCKPLKVLLDPKDQTNKTYKIVPGIEPKSLGVVIAKEKGITAPQIRETLEKRGIVAQKSSVITI